VERVSLREGYPEPPELSEEELAGQRRRARRMGLAILALCVLVAAVTLVVLLSLNSESRDEGARPPVPVRQA
jgi:hypothetical protein